MPRPGFVQAVPKSAALTRSFEALTGHGPTEEYESHYRMKDVAMSLHCQHWQIEMLLRHNEAVSPTRFHLSPVSTLAVESGDRIDALGDAMLQHCHELIQQLLSISISNGFRRNSCEEGGWQFFTEWRSSKFFFHRARLKAALKIVELNFCLDCRGIDFLGSCKSFAAALSASAFYQPFQSCLEESLLRSLS